MTDEQIYASDWLNRNFHKERKIMTDVRNRERILATLSGIGKYDAEFIPAQTGENATETKLLEFSRLSAEIEKEVRELLIEDGRTRDVIEKIGNTSSDERLKAVLIDRYLNRLKWEEVARLQNYSTQRLKQLHAEALTRVAPFIPKGEILD